MIKQIYKLFPRQFNRIVYENEVIHKDWRDLCEVDFVDDEGRKYYRYKQDYKMPIQRAQYVDSLKVNYLLTWSQVEQSEFDKKLESWIRTIEKKPNFQSWYKQMAEISKLIEEKQKRQGQIIQTDILIELVACLLIREDEDPFEVNSQILAQKVETFKKKINFQFLKQRHILEVIGLSEITEQQYNQLWEYSTKIAQAREKLLNSTTKE